MPSGSVMSGAERMVSTSDRLRASSGSRFSGFGKSNSLTGLASSRRFRQSQAKRVLTHPIRSR